MKSLIVISLLCLSAWGGYAQTADDNDARLAVHERAMAIFCKTNGNMGPAAKMHYKTTYSNVHAEFPDAPTNATQTGNPACYRFKNTKGSFTTKCPNTTSPKCAAGAPVNDDLSSGGTQLNGATNFEARSFSGNYPELHAIYPQAPANAVAVWPTSDYVPLQNPPCYRYTNKRGLVVTECPGARFPPEHRYRD